jgi:hypothetical protein
MIAKIKTWLLVAGGITIGVMGLMISILINSKRKAEYLAMIENDQEKKKELKDIDKEIKILEKELKTEPDTTKEDRVKWLKDRYSHL